MQTLRVEGSGLRIVWAVPEIGGPFIWGGGLLMRTRMSFPIIGYMDS